MFGCEPPDNLDELKINSFKEQGRSTVRTSFGPSFSAVTFDNPTAIKDAALQKQTLILGSDEQTTYIVL